MKRKSRIDFERVSNGQMDDRLHCQEETIIVLHTLIRSARFMAAKQALWHFFSSAMAVPLIKNMTAEI